MKRGHKALGTYRGRRERTRVEEYPAMGGGDLSFRKKMRAGERDTGTDSRLGSSVFLLFVKQSVWIKIMIWGRAQWLTPAIPALWEAEVGESLELKSRDQLGQHGETLSLLKIQKN